LTTREAVSGEHANYSKGTAMTPTRSLGLALVLLILSVPTLRSDPPKEEKKEPAEVSYYKDVRPIFVVHCQGCHQPAKAQGRFVMTSHADMLKNGESDQPGIVPGKPDLSKIVSQIAPGKDGKAAMPKGKDPLAAKDIELIKKWIAAGAKDDTPMSAKQTIDMEHPPVYPLPPLISSIAYSPDSTLLAVSGYHEVLLHKADGSGLVARLVGLAERVQSVAFSPDGKRLAVAGGSPGRFGEIQIWDVKRKKLKLSQSVTFDTLYGVSWAPDGSKVAFGCSDNTLRAIDALTGKQVLYQGAHSDWVLGTAFSREGDYVLSVSRDRSMKMTELATQRFIDNVTSITPGALKGGLMAVARRPMKDKKMSKVPPDTPGATPKPYDEMLIGGSDSVPKIYKIHREAKRVIGDDFNKVRDFEAMPGRIHGVSFNADGSQFVVGSSRNSETGEARVYNVADGKKLATLEGIKGGVYCVAYRPDGAQVAVAGFEGIVRLYDPKTGKVVKEFVPVPVAKEAASK
jgi:WD40 repeat protein